MIEIMLYAIAIFILYRISTRKERREKRLNRLAWFIAKRKLRKMQKNGEIDAAIDINSIKLKDVFPS